MNEPTANNARLFVFMSAKYGKIDSARPMPDHSTTGLRPTLSDRAPANRMTGMLNNEMTSMIASSESRDMPRSLEA